MAETKRKLGPYQKDPLGGRRTRQQIERHSEGLRAFYEKGLRDGAAPYRAAWEFLLHQQEIPGATLRDYIDAAQAYAYDATGVDITAPEQFRQ